MTRGRAGFPAYRKHAFSNQGWEVWRPQRDRSHSVISLCPGNTTTDQNTEYVEKPHTPAKRWPATACLSGRLCRDQLVSDRFMDCREEAGDKMPGPSVRTPRLSQGQAHPRRMQSVSARGSKVVRCVEVWEPESLKRTAKTGPHNDAHLSNERQPCLNTFTI